MDNEEIRRRANDILQNQDFQQYQDKSQDWLSQLLKWLHDLFHNKTPDYGTSPGMKMDPAVWGLFAETLKLVVIAAAVIALLALIHWLVTTYLLHKGPVEEPGLHVVSEQQRQEAQDMYLRMAHDALKDQDYRGAIHYMFMAAVSQVIRDSLFHGTKAMTNREIAGASDFSRFGQPQQMSLLFNQMVFYDEPRWFGTVDVSSNDVNQFQQIYGQFAAGLKHASERHA